LHAPPLIKERPTPDQLACRTALADRSGATPTGARFFMDVGTACHFPDNPDSSRADFHPYLPGKTMSSAGALL